MSNNSPYVETSLRFLGNSIKDARRRRNISTKLMAERLGVTRTTLTKMEKGDGGVSIKIFALALFMLDVNKLESWSKVMANDDFGCSLLDSKISKRIHGASKK